ncbi:MAG: DUF4912 domain-containing protein [Candidatus Omnitrophica bacterium]|nr:DUF4912 domain-containing protein [Candidatus Omnitrophota bacterium]MDD5429357.1 DUF4912 domain-containing protein [Candidatus Omnitrophota bacterium]
MAKKRKVIKRIYEKGKETTLVSKKKKVSSLKKKRSSIPAGNIRKLAIASSAIKKKQSLKRERAKGSVKVEYKPKISLLEDYKLPFSYDSTRLVLMVKDPFWLYAYWEVSAGAINFLKSRFPQKDFSQAGLTLRMYDVTYKDFNGRNANHYFDIEVGPKASNWYIKLWSDDVSYVGEIGLKIGWEFFSLARSNFVHTPRSGHSSRNEQIWMNVTDDEYKPSQAAYSKINGIASGHQLPRVRKISLTEEDIRNYYSKLSPSLRDVLSRRLKGSLFKQTFPDRLILEGESKLDRQKFFSMLGEGYSIKRLSAGSSQEILILGQGQKTDVFVSASDNLQEFRGKRKFFFELDTELIVYGRTEPDAQVFLGDKPVALRDDGTFSMRRVLIDGKIPLEFRAIAADKQQEKSINVSVEKNTKYR